MPVIENASRQIFELPGLNHRTLASHADGLKNMEVWLQTLEKSAETPVHYHECDEVVVVLKGSGRVILDDEECPFGPGTTLIIPPKVIHQIISGDDEEMLLVATFPETPGRVFAPDGQLMNLPWA